MPFVCLYDLSTGELLAKGVCFTLPSIGSSFRAEGYGKVPLLKLFYHLCYLMLTYPTWNLLIYNDNESFVDKLTKQLKYCVPLQTSTTKPDWDVFEEIALTIQALSYQV